MSNEGKTQWLVGRHLDNKGLKIGTIEDGVEDMARGGETARQGGG